MIQTTNDVREFIEEHDEPIYIYGAGNPGNWVGYYMKKCGIVFEGYLDKGCALSEDCEVRLKGNRVYNPRILKKYKNQRLRIIIAVHDVDSVLGNLHWMAEQNDLYCLVPYYLHVSFHEKRYNINQMLGYFRAKLFKGDVPTIISNQCDAGHLYTKLGLPMMSPTINTGIYPNDFLKLCRNPRKYFEKDIEGVGYELVLGETVPLGRVEDIEVFFPHDKTMEESIRRWNTLRKWVNYDNMVFIMSDSTEPIMSKTQIEFMQLEGKKLLVLKEGKPYWGEYDKNVLSVSFDYFLSCDVAIENYFDILGWLNGDF